MTERSPRTAGTTRRGDRSHASVAAVVFGVLLAGSVFPSAPLGSAGEPPALSPDRVRSAGATLRDPARLDRLRIDAARALVESGEPDGLRLVLDAIGNVQERALLRAAWVLTLGRTPLREPAAVFVAARLGDPSEAHEVRAAAATSLGSLAPESARTSLTRAAADAVPPVRLAARLALVGLVGAVDRVAILVQIVEDQAQPRGPRARAARALGDLGDTRALSALLEALNVPVPTGTPPTSAVEFLASRIAVQEHLPASAARALGRLGEPAALAGLLAAAQSPDVELRIAVFEALAVLKPPSAADAARRELADPSDRVRRWAAVTLGAIGSRDAAVDLRRALTDPDAGVRVQAARALGELQDRDSLDALEAAYAVETTPGGRAALETVVARLRGARPP